MATVASPAFFNALAAKQHPAGDMAAVRHAYRTYSGEIWSNEKSWSWARYEALPNRPEASTGVPVNTSTNNGRADFNAWYYACFALLDAHVDSLSAPALAASEARQEYLYNRVWLMPGAAVYSQLAAFANTSHSDLTSFVSRTREVHDEIKAVYYPKLMTRDSLDEMDLQTLSLIRR